LEILSHQQLGASMQKQVTVFIGRFSPFHLGHEEVLLRALQSSEVVLLLIGSARQARNIKNPFTEQERADVITTWYVNQRRFVDMYNKPKMGTLLIEPLVDSPYNDSEWIAQVQETVLRVRHNINVPLDWPNILTGAQRDASTWYLKAFGSFFKTDFVSETKVGFDHSATDVRDNLFKGGNAWEYKTPPETIAFLDKWTKTEHYQNMVEEYKFVTKYKESWKAAPYAPTFVTVDACVIQSGHVLVVTRAAQPGRGQIALPGGFVEQNETLLDACIRELQEETSIQMSPAQLYGSVRDKEIFDNPNRSLRGRTITTCFLLKLQDTYSLPKIKPQRGEGLSVRWLPIAEAQTCRELWYEDHYSIFMTMLGRVK
jgi:bifunctional NMN adenylyltransferase/nudix hydrolase